MSGKILVIDDEPALTTMLRRGLEAEGFDVETADGGLGGLALAQRERPDVVILDVMLPEIDGFEVCRSLRSTRAGDNLAIIMLTARVSPRDRVFGLENGADDYLTKPFHLAELVARIRVQLRRREAASATALRYSQLALDTEAHTASWDDTPLVLTPKEFEILEVLARNPRRVMTRERIADGAWGDDFAAESNVIDVYVGRLRRKLEAVSKKPLIHTIRGIGYMLNEEPPPESGR
ncbi:MAG: response regulator transcription factor [Chloroflexi bacterium]|nr:response regulator transcription factor [Chloroflexota bacterium]